MLSSAVVNSKDEAEKLIAEKQSVGLQVAAMSNAGLSGDAWRITFLPDSAFIKPPHAGETE